MANKKPAPKVKPFDSFLILYKIIGWAGFYNLLDKPKNKYFEYLHYFYRFLVCFFLITYNIQLILYILTTFEEDEELALDALRIELPNINVIVKIIAVNAWKAKLEKLKEVMNDPIFAPRSEKDEELLMENRDTFPKLAKRVIMAVGGSVFFWLLSTILARMKDPSSVVPIYVPFSTDSWPRFLIAVAMDQGPIFWTGFGHLTLDILIACHYSQATVQLKIIRYNLEHLCDSDIVTDIENEGNYRYLDEMDDNIKERFTHYVDRYAKVIWFVDETTAVFSSAIFCQFLTTSTIVCLVVYKMTLLQPGSLEFGFFIGFFFVMQIQVNLHCYFVELLITESTFVAESAYQSDWFLLSPRFRKQLLLAMTRWSKPFGPYAAGVVPVTLKSFVTLLRGAFNLFTILKNTNHT